MKKRLLFLFSIFIVFSISACAKVTTVSLKQSERQLPMVRGIPNIPVKKLQPPSEGTCIVTPGQAGNKALLIQGNILAPLEVYVGGEILIDQDGVIVCVQPDCSQNSVAKGATVITCAEGVVSPGLINAHDHINWDQAKPAYWGTERFDQRNDWRKGLRGHTKIPYYPNNDPNVVAWTELRQILSGTTTIASSPGDAGVPGLMRNLNQEAQLEEGLKPRTVYNQVFPLGDSDGTQLETTCNYPNIVGPDVLNNDDFNPHVSEGVDQVAHNEFLCLSGQQAGGVYVTSPKSSFIHSIALRPNDAKILKDTFTSVIWSPRSNISLYGNTAQLTLYDHLGIWNIALSTDWTPSGSMNLLRELKCADYLNADHFNAYFTDYQLWRMVTENPSVAMSVADQIGFLRPGYFGDITIYDGKGSANYYRAVINAGIKDTVLVLRGGIPLFGDEDVIDALPSAGPGCEEIPGGICSGEKAVCLDVVIEGKKVTFSDLALVNQNSYPLFFCSTPSGEPTCEPMRPKDKWQCGNYPLEDPTHDRDGDGVLDEVDNCPTIFNPVRPLDGYYAENPYACKQADYDKDGLGDVCDPSPLGY